MLLLCASVCVSHAQKLEGSWTGKLSVQGVQLTLVFHVEKDKNSGFIVTMDSPDQSVKGVPATVNSLTADSVDIAISSIGARYLGKQQGDHIQGTFTQFGKAFPLMLNRGAEELKRPQTPHAPYPYQTEEVTFQNAKANAVFSGTLTYPVGYEQMNKQKVPVVLMVTGSGQENRNEEMFDHQPFLVLADYFARHGIASLRYDDRGFAKSTGDASQSTMKENSEDARCGFNYLKSLKKFGKIGVMGHSEGGSIAMMLAAESLPDFIVSLAGMAERGDSLMLRQVYQAMEARGGASFARDYCKVLGAIYAYRNAKKDISHPEVVLDTLLKQTNVSLPALSRQSLLPVITMQTPWVLDFIATDMACYLPKIKCPVMALNGSKDVQVDAHNNLSALRKGLKPNKKNLIKEYEGLNHLFQHCTTGQTTEYRLIEETFAPEVMQDIVDWIKAL
mgnify:CR=1 FL=1